tara:strand:- start:2418 stop:2756 length:339 start_codon:yes stop_codon:yes gene_type:complete
MKKEHFSLLLGFFFLVLSVSFSFNKLGIDQNNDQHTISAAWNQLAPTEINSNGLQLKEQLRLNWKSSQWLQINDFIKAFHHRDFGKKFQLHLSQHLLNDKVPIIVWVQCFRN